MQTMANNARVIDDITAYVILNKMARELSKELDADVRSDIEGLIRCYEQGMNDHGYDSREYCAAFDNILAEVQRQLVVAEVRNQLGV